MASTDSLYGTRELTLRERQVATLVVEGLSNREIGEQMGLCEGTIKHYLRAIFDKAGVWSRTELAMWIVGRRMTAHRSLRRRKVK